MRVEGFRKMREWGRDGSGEVLVPAAFWGSISLNRG